MAESSAHMVYVSMLGEFVKNRLPEQEHIHILIDSPSSNDYPPQVINNFRPDLYYLHDNTLVIGEAKTDADFDRPHSIEQYKSYLKECKSFSGTAYVVFAGSCRISAGFANLIRHIRRDESLTTRAIIINELGVFREII
jgi:hypothetical protein